MDLFFDPRRAPQGVTNIAVPSIGLDWAKCGTPPDIIAQNCKRFKGRFIPRDETLPTLSAPVAIVGYGASLKNTWEELETYKVIFTCSGAHHFLLKRGIIPDYHAESDPQVHKARMLGDVHPNVTYLPASICHPSYMDRLEDTGAYVELWHPFLMDEEKYRQIPKGDYVIPGSTIIGPRMMRLARLLGYTNLHIYGIDGSGGHADEHPNRKLYDKSRKVRYQGKEYTVNEHLFVHIGAMFAEFNDYPDDVKFTWHGDGLIQEMAKTFVPKPSEIYHPFVMIKDD